VARFNDLTDRQFGRLTAVERLPPHGKNKAFMWACKCECGGTAIVRGTDLVNGHTMSCGCYRKMQRAIPNGQLRLHRISESEILINPSGRFVLGGFVADTGLTGRKLMVDTYGGKARHGGGAMSGKDASKVDRSGAYLARYIAKNIVAAKLADECEVSLSYAIGVPRPTAIDVNTFYTGIISDKLITDAVNKVFDLTVGGTIDKLDLKRPVYTQTAVGGHFGKLFLAWEMTDKTEELNDAVRP